MFDDIETVDLPQHSTGGGAAKKPTGQDGTFLNRAARDLPFLKEDGFENDQLGEFLSEEPHLADREYIEPAVEQGAKAAGKKGLFGNLFSEAPKSDEDLEAELGGDLDGIGPELAFEIGDAIFPSVIGVIEEEDAQNFKADPDQKSKLIHAWTLFLKGHRVRVTPGLNLIIRNVQVYILPRLGSVLKYWTRVQLYGFHWPWSDSWKVKKKQMEAAQFGRVASAPVQQAPQQQQVAPVYATPAPPPPVYTQPVMEVVREEPVQQPQVQTPPAPVVTTAVPKLKTCLYTGEKFREGNGFPKTSTNQDFVDGFVSMTAYRSYRNANGLMGAQAGKKK